MLGFDCASIVKPEWAPQLRALGYEFFCRYYRRTLVSKWAISPEEAKPLFDAGLWALAIFQFSDKASELTKSGALADAAAALAKAEQMKQPKSSTIYFAVDFAPHEEQMLTVLDYFDVVAHAVVAEGYVVGVYGPGAVCQRVIDASLAKCGWLAGATAWPGYREFKDRAAVIQKMPSITLPFGLEIDEDEAVSPEVAGLWRP
jgi:hypothetical protein